MFLNVKAEFEHAVGIDVSEVFKGGSMGQGTTVPYNYDIDLVLYSCKWYTEMSKVLTEQEEKNKASRSSSERREEGTCVVKE